MMPRLAREYAAALSVTAMAVPAGAAKESSPYPVLSAEYLNYGRTSWVLRGLVRCLADKDPVSARQLLQLPFGSDSQRAALTAFASNGKWGNACLAGASSMRTEPRMFIGYLAEYVMTHDPAMGFRQPLIPERMSVTPGRYSWTALGLTKQQMSDVYHVAACLVGRHRSAVESLLATPQTSTQERKLFNSMGPGIADCVSDGRTWVLHPMILRSALAINYYLATRVGASDSAELEKAQ